LAIAVLQASAVPIDERIAAGDLER